MRPLLGKQNMYAKEVVNFDKKDILILQTMPSLPLPQHELNLLKKENHSSSFLLRGEWGCG